MAVPSPDGDLKLVSPVSNFRAEYIDTQKKCFFKKQSLETDEKKTFG